LDSTDKFRVVLRMQTIPGRAEEFEQAWVAGAAIIMEEPANLGQSLSKSADEDNVYYIVSDWVDEPGFREYERSQRHVEHRSRLHPYRVSGSMMTMSMIDEMIGTGTRA